MTAQMIQAISSRTYDTLKREGWTFRPVHRQWSQAGAFRTDEQAKARVAEILTAQGFEHTEADIDTAMPALVLRWTTVRHSREGIQRIWPLAND